MSPQTKEICRPCAEQLKAAGKIKILMPKRDKSTCEICQRRKYVYECEVIKNAKRKV